MEVFAKIPIGKSITLEAESFHTVYNVKVRTLRKEGICLLVRGKFSLCLFIHLRVDI